MAIVQISRITNRKGLQENLPQLAGAELGWSVDERRLFIGNGTLQEGAPVIGNTEILTEFSDILQFQTTYTYKGSAAGYIVQTGPTADNPVKQSLQSWFDQFASVKDFGAIGDGVADDTDAINRALYQLYCVEVNPQIRRSLFFPAGVYRTTSTIFIPPYAALWGEGVNSSVIQMDNSLDDSTLSEYVARFSDSLQQYGANIGTNGAIPPTDINIANLGFRSLDPTSNIFLVQDATNCRFQSVGFFGPLTSTDLSTEITDTAAVRFASTSSLVTSQIVFDNCQISGTIFGFTTATAIGGIDNVVNGVTVSNSTLEWLYQGVRIGTETLSPGTNGATGFRVMGNKFDNIYAEGVLFGDVSLNATGHNIFYGVGNHLGPSTTPYTAVIDIQSSNNVSISDMFERADAYAQTTQSGISYPRITLNDTASIATTNGVQLALGTYVIESGQAFTLESGVTTQAIFEVNANVVRGFNVNYTIVRGDSRRTGVMVVATAPSVSVAYTDSYTENLPSGIVLGVTENLSGIVTVDYTSTAGVSGTITYNITHLA